MVNRIVVALDFPELDSARRVAESLTHDVAGFKVGLELMTAAGPRAIEQIASLGMPVFVDMKLHDIPNTVLGAAGRVADAGARWVTAHAAGGKEMLEAAVTGMGGAGVLAVTVLTSFSEGDLESVGVQAGLESQVVGLAQLAVEAGVEGLVCAPGDVAAIRSKDIRATIFTPGIRMESSPAHDQKRVGTPIEAVSAGADYLVVGRPITGAADPGAAARRITASLARIA